MYYVYIITGYSNKVLYIGMTNDLKRRITEHKNGQVDGFIKRYRLKKLVYFEEFLNPAEAIKREKELKGWRREKKNALIETKNPKWEDLYF